MLTPQLADAIQTHKDIIESKRRDLRTLVRFRRMTLREAAAHLEISHRTAERYRSRLRSKGEW